MHLQTIVKHNLHKACQHKADNNEFAKRMGMQHNCIFFRLERAHGLHDVPIDNGVLHPRRQLVEPELMSITHLDEFAVNLGVGPLDPRLQGQLRTLASQYKPQLDRPAYLREFDPQQTTRETPENQTVGAHVQNKVCSDKIGYLTTSSKDVCDQGSSVAIKKYKIV